VSATYFSPRKDRTLRGEQGCERGLETVMIECLLVGAQAIHDELPRQTFNHDCGRPQFAAMEPERLALKLQPLAPTIIGTMHRDRFALSGRGESRA